LDIVIRITFIILSVALILAFLRLAKGPTLPDRVVALELLASLTVGFIAVHTIFTDEPHFIDVAVVLALTAFLAAVGFARYLERGGKRDD
jgi:multicomponent Na+:H+ antiporter subunit F